MWGQHVEKKRVLILGGGFGGVATAQHLRKLFKKDPGVEVTLVNRENFFVFIPLLASAASGSIETLHILNPIRRMIPGIPFRAEEVTDIDLQRRLVTTTSPITGREVRLSYDHLVLALGNTINLASLPGVAQHGKTMKSLGDALHLRNHIISMLEAADVETDLKIRQELLTFVVAGAGYSGVETVGELNDLVHAITRHYPSVTRESVKVDFMHQVVQFSYRLDAAIARSCHHERQQFLANFQIGLYIGGFEHGNNVIAQVQCIAQAFHGFPMLRYARQGGQVDGIAQGQDQVIVG